MAREAGDGEAVIDGLVALYGERARLPLSTLERPWGADPFTRGYITSWAPGDVGRVGPHRAGSV